MWNHKTCKQQVMFRQQTYAHKLHLDKLTCMKSTLDNYNNQWSLHKKINKQGHKRTPFLQRSRLNQIQHENITLLNRIVNIEKLMMRSTQEKFKSATFYNQNIQHSMSRKRNRLFYEIKTQNSHMANRIDKVHPTLLRSSWQGDQLKTKKYKNNIIASRFAKPDYTQQAKRFKLTKNDSFNHLRFKKLDNKNLPKLNKSVLDSNKSDKDRNDDNIVIVQLR